MKRRTVLKLTGGTVLAGGSIAGGYQALSERSACDSDVRGHQWSYGVTGRLDAVSDDMVFVRERTDGEIVALDAKTGEVRWTYGEAVGMDSYTDLEVQL